MQWLVLITLIVCSGCAYNPPVQTSALNNSALLNIPMDTAWTRSLQALAADGAMIKTAERSQGIIATGPKTIRLTEEQADCGNIWGIPYLKDSRTTTDLSYAVLLRGEGEVTRITVNTQIEGKFNAAASEQTKQLSCVSRGGLETALIERIRASR